MYNYKSYDLYSLGLIIYNMYELEIFPKAKNPYEITKQINLYLNNIKITENDNPED
jgi:hypothetical protein